MLQLICVKLKRCLFYVRHDSVLDQCPLGTHSLSGDFSTTAGTDKLDYELCDDFYVFDTRNTNGSILNFAKFRKLKITVSW